MQLMCVDRVRIEVARLYTSNYEVLGRARIKVRFIIFTSVPSVIPGHVSYLPRPKSPAKSSAAISGLTPFLM
jgi:hypothetical protein